MLPWPDDADRGRDLTASSHYSVPVKGNPPGNPYSLTVMLGRAFRARCEAYTQVSRV